MIIKLTRKHYIVLNNWRLSFLASVILFSTVWKYFIGGSIKNLKNLLVIKAYHNSNTVLYSVYTILFSIWTKKINC